MTRLYKGVRVKRHRVYSVDDLMKLYKVSRNTVSNWVMAGLIPSDKQRPHRFRGDVLIRFHAARRAQLTRGLGPGEFKCFGCKAAVIPSPVSVAKRYSRTGGLRLDACCPDCGRMISKFANETDRDAIAACLNPNTTMGRSGEGLGPAPSGIWTKPTFVVTDLVLVNDRLIYDWQTYAGRYDQKTIDKHVASIRFCESAVGNKDFANYTCRDLSAVRTSLIAQLDAESERRKSKSFIRHRASELRGFFTWLLKQKGYGRLPKDLADHLELPRAIHAIEASGVTRPYPTMDEAAKMLVGMPTKSILDRRARAIFALAFLGALRADTLISLRMKHIDVERQVIQQNASEMRTKNGKSLEIGWFPIAPAFSETVVGWKSEMTERRLRGNDALFPANTVLEGAWRHRPVSSEPIPVMRSKCAVNAAFARACAGGETQYTPHSAKHAIAAERDRRPLTQEGRKAWSENMGHESEQITTSHYGRLPPERRLELVRTSSGGLIGRSAITDSEKIAIVDAVLASMR